MAALYRPSYFASHALIVGIDRYQHVSPLSYAVNDATAVAEVVKSKFGFLDSNVTLLTDGAATRAAITSAFLKFSDSDSVGPDDRVFIFYAGHGHTASGRRGETGFLVPVDGDVSDLSTLVRWDELTRNADLISAKHVFFLMDACYGGLALTRKSIPPGSMRLLNDMLQRFSRQVLTAGKADEVVSDGGGIRPGHSIFTSHVLEALDGAASATEGVITANGLMAYVYEKVGNDPLSHQTPHYGFLEGDGDFIFAPTIVDSENTDQAAAVLVQTPTFAEPEVPAAKASFAEEFKQLLANPSDKIRLDDFVSAHLRKAVQETSLDKFPIKGSLSAEEFVDRLEAYEKAIEDLEIAVILLARWAQPDQLKLLERIFSRMGEVNRGNGGLVVWLRLGWYPVFRLMYAAGISALSQGRFDALRAALLAPVQADHMGQAEQSRPVIVPAVDAMTQIVDQFKLVPGFERRYAPRSDYLFQTMQSELEDQLFLGQSYERLFDDFEIMLALIYADLQAGEPVGHVWGPVGRFGWKGRLGGGSAPIPEFVQRAQKEGASWGPLKEGLFRGTPDRFLALANSYGESVSKLGWF